MQSPSDELLMAFADGELTGEERRAINKQINENPELAERLKVFVETREPILQLLTKAASQPVPDRIVALIQDYEPSRQPRSFKPSHLWKMIFGDATPWEIKPQIAAVGLLSACMVGYFASTILPASKLFTAPARNVDHQQVAGTFRLDSPLGAALTNTPSGNGVRLGANDAHSLTFQAVISFRNEDGRYCRQYSLRRPIGSGVDGIACRSADGWTDKIRVAAQKKSKPGYRPASRPDNNEIDAALTRMISGTALGFQEEKEAIKGLWEGN